MAENKNNKSTISKQNIAPKSKPVPNNQQNKPIAMQKPNPQTQPRPVISNSNNKTKK